MLCGSVIPATSLFYDISNGRAENTNYDSTLNLSWRYYATTTGVFLSEGPSGFVFIVEMGDCAVEVQVDGDGCLLALQKY